ncbi:MULTISPECIES: carbon-nitrogen hydrolase family protein [unclassified Serratia (in: enterobacteria)]|uniref:carbon-nitrogen hydrolase family protein n=1 Tax=unclassified Serratia (in: enterobacteria) TaxID=2647522 RepID=UPI002ED657AC|nr:carbon-nitrogen hydrolase family protein [Serratia sp. C2(2)]MEE4447053.1 carbon-nitrogen hydrolase family protein [Serratia sp. C2(1)]
MPRLTIAAAQYSAVAADIDRNLDHHLTFIRQAAAQHVQLLIFPELSLTGYELNAARRLALTLDDPRLQPLADAAKQQQMTLVVGAPLNDGTELFIGALTFSPDGNRNAYTKQHLHGAEKEIFYPGNGGPLLTVSQRRIALAICADTAHPEHAADAAIAGAEIYAAGVLVSQAGYPIDSSNLASYAQQHGIVTLMANHAGPTGGWIPAGRSAIWDETGQQVASVPDSTQGLLIAENRPNGWHGRYCRLS